MYVNTSCVCVCVEVHITVHIHSYSYAWVCVRSCPQFSFWLEMTLQGELHRRHGICKYCVHSCIYVSLLLMLLLAICFCLKVSVGYDANLKYSKTSLNNVHSSLEIPARVKHPIMKAGSWKPLFFLIAAWGCFFLVDVISKEPHSRTCYIVCIKG